MATTYTQAESDVMNAVARVISDSFHELARAKVKIDVLLAANPDGPAVMLHGYPCAAVVKKVSYRNRVKGFGDAEITLNQEWWNDATERQQQALLHHELTHLEVMYDVKTGKVKRDRADRPKLAMKLHDWQLGGFEDTARIYGKDAPEVQMAQEFKTKFGQYVFDFAKGKSAPQ